MTDKIPDSQWLASMVVAAFTEDRIELGAALARICLQAHRIEQAGAMLPAPVPATVGPEVYEPTHVQQPEPMPEQAHSIALVPDYVEPDPGPCRYPIAPGAICGRPWEWHKAVDRGHPFSDAASVPAESAPTAVNPVVPSARCIAQRPGGGECHAVIYWSEPADQGEGVWRAAGWEHLDGIHDHEPVPDRPIS